MISIVQNSPVTIPVEGDAELRMSESTPVEFKGSDSNLGRSEFRLSQQTLGDSSIGRASQEFKYFQPSSDKKPLPPPSNRLQEVMPVEFMDESLLVNEQFPGDQSILFDSQDLQRELHLESLSTPYADHLIHQMNQSTDSIKDILKSTETSVPIDAAELYRTIKEKISKEAFDRFATAITLFNAGSKTPLQTIEEVGGLLQDEDLTLQMSKLICSAIQ
jgi:hypothetical protein